MEVKFEEGSQLTSIEAWAFADNKNLSKGSNPNGSEIAEVHLYAQWGK